MTMSSRLARSSLGNEAVMLSAPEKEERKSWGKLCNLTKEMRSLVLGYSDAEVLLRQIMGLVVEKARVEDGGETSKATPLLKNLIILAAEQFNMIPLGNSVHVSWDSTFSEENVDANAPCMVLSIAEAQSSGESYLPSILFRTMFPLMEAKFERTQTAKRISASGIDPSVLMLDIKGLDQTQIGQETLFANQAAYFALIVSDIMMVSISTFDIVHEQGRGKLLFKTIFQERTRLPPGLITIVIVVRDYDGKKPMEKLNRLMEQVWTSVNSVSEPKAFRDYFGVHVFGLPNEKSRDFQKEVTDLKNQVMTITRSVKLPASNLVEILRGQIKQSERFDLPSHMMLLGTLSCQQTAKARIGNIDNGDLKAGESPKDFTKVAHELYARTRSEYNESDKEHQHMVNMELILKIQEKESKQFNKRIGKLTTKEDYNLLTYYEKAVEPYVMIFTNLCEDLKLIDPNYIGNNCAFLRKELTLYIALHILSLKEEHARIELEAEQVGSNQKMEAMTKKLDQRTKDKVRREDEIQQEKELHDQEITKAKEQLQYANAKIAQLELTVQRREQSEGMRAKEELKQRVQMPEQNTYKYGKEELGLKDQVLDQNKCQCDEKFERRLQVLEQYKEKCEKKDRPIYQKFLG